MNPADLPLRDIHIPAPPPWWPPAPGWWTLLGLCTIVAIALVWWLRWRRLTAARRAALAHLRAAAAHYASARDAQVLAAEISALLRRLALTLRPRHEVAGVAGSAWFDLLDRLSPRAPFDATTRRVLMEAPYRPNPACDCAALIAACERWLRTLPARAQPVAPLRAAHSQAPVEAPR
jgi:Domain of unknown function (DUF4381)